MSHFEPELDIHEQHAYYSDLEREAKAANTCENCNSTYSWYLLHEYLTDDGRNLLLCEECCEAEQRIEKRAAELAAVESACERRQQLIERAQTTRELVNRLEAHDKGGCNCFRKPVVAVVANLNEEVA